jgi:outer membrane protein assembly factor BamD
MPKNFIKVASLTLVVLLSGCGLFQDKADETKNWTAAKLYSEASDEMASGNYERAVPLFERLESRYPFGTYAQQAQINIAYSWYKAADQAQALAAAERFIKLHPNHPNVDYMYYLRGLINFNDRSGIFDFVSQQDMTERDPKGTREAFDSFKLLVDRFPDSQYTPDAIDRMKYLVNAMAQYDVHVANYYYRRGAYVAALDRAKNAVAEYRTAPAVEEALFVMVRCYDQLGMTDLRDDANRVFLKNYPDSVFLKGGRAKKDAWWKLW